MSSKVEGVAQLLNATLDPRQHKQGMFQLSGLLHELLRFAGLRRATK